MSFNNRQEDIDAIRNLQDGEDYEFNTFQDGGAEVRFVDGNYELYELKMYSGTPMHHDDFCYDDIETIVNMVYDEWT